MGTAAFVVLKLGTRAFQVAVMKQPLQPAGQILRTTANQGDDLMRTQKPMPVDEPDDFVVALRQPDGRDFGDALKAWQSGHPSNNGGSVIGSKDVKICRNRQLAVYRQHKSTHQNNTICCMPTIRIVHI